jgi:hypothetical protein
MTRAGHELSAPAPRRHVGSHFTALLVLHSALALAGCGGEESALTDDLAGPGDLRAGAAAEGPHAPPWLAGGDPVTHLTQALDEAGIAGAERTKVNELVADFRKRNADTIAKLGRAAEKARVEADQGNAPDRARWRELVAAEGVEPGALRDEIRSLRQAINAELTPAERQKLRAAWWGEGGRPGRRGGSFGRFGQRVIAELDLTSEQQSKIQSLVADFGARHQGEIRALRSAFAEAGGPPEWGAERGPGRGDCPEPGAGPGLEAGPGPRAGRGPHAGRGQGRGMGPGGGLGLGPHLKGQFETALTTAGYDPEAFKKDLAALHDQAVQVLTPEQKEKLRGHGLHLIRRLLEPAETVAPGASAPEGPAKP